jgi:hypothetical protein
MHKPNPPYNPIPSMQRQLDELRTRLRAAESKPPLLDQLKKLPPDELQRLFDQLPPTSRRRKRRSEHDWRGRAHGELLRIIARTGKIPDNDSATAQVILAMFRDKDDWEPDERDLRELIAELLRPARDF